MSASAACVSWKSASMLAEHRRASARARAPRRARVARSRARRRRPTSGTRRACASRAEALALGADAVASPGMRQPSKPSLASGCGAMTSMRSAIENPASAGSTTNALMPRRTTRRRRAAAGRGAREHAIEIGDAAVRDPRLRAVEHAVIAVAPRLHCHRGDVGSGCRLRQRECGDRLAARHARQPSRAQRLDTRDRERAAAEPLHREREVGEAVMPARAISRSTQIDARIEVVRARRRRPCARNTPVSPPCPSRRTSARHAASTSARVSRMRRRARGWPRPSRARRGCERRCSAPKNGHSQVLDAGTARPHQSPSKTGLRFADERLDRRGGSRRLHADRLRLRLRLDRLVDAHVPFLVQHRLGHRVRERRPRRQLARRAVSRLGEQSSAASTTR